jgi:hypothetical protein
MNEIIEISKAAGQVYVVYIMALIILNAFVKNTFWHPAKSLKSIIAVSSSILFLLFWFWGAGFWKLILYTFFIFGFYDWVGIYIEQLFKFIAFQMIEATKKTINRIKEKVKK